MAHHLSALTSRKSLPVEKTSSQAHVRLFRINRNANDLFRVDRAEKVISPAPHFDCARKDRIFSFLRQAEQRLVDPALPDHVLARTMREIYGVLHGHKKSCATLETWKKFIVEARKESIINVLHQDPFTGRAFHKPRGYAGDAVLMDYIYDRELERNPPNGTEVGRRIYLNTAASSACRGVAARRGLIADVIDDVAGRIRYPAILSLAAGHMREAEISSAVQRKKVGRLVAIDSDAESLAEIERSYPSTNIDCIHATARQIMSGKIDNDSYDLIYSSGLYDYLNDGIGTKLTTRLFSKLNPGGKLLLTNFLPDIECIGYMETYMDWNLIFRNRSQMVSLTSGIEEEEVARVSAFAEEQFNIVFCVIEKR
jgi:hypothetical protein